MSSQGPGAGVALLLGAAQCHQALASGQLVAPAHHLVYAVAAVVAVALLVVVVGGGVAADILLASPH